MGRMQTTSGQRASGALRSSTSTGSVQRSRGGHRGIFRWLQQVLEDASAGAGNEMLAPGYLTAPCTRVGSSLVVCSGREAGSGVSVGGLNLGRTKSLPLQGPRCFLRCVLGSGTSAGHSLVQGRDRYRLRSVCRGFVQG